MATHSPIEAGPSTAQQVEQDTVTGTPGATELSQIDVARIEAKYRHGTETTLGDYMAGMSKLQKAHIMVDVLNHELQEQEVLNMSLEYLWNTYVAPERLWEHYDGGAAKFRKDVSYLKFIAPAPVSARETNFQKKRSRVELETNWGPEWQKAIDPHSGTAVDLSEKYLKELARLSRHMTLPRAAHFIQYARFIRTSNPGKGIRKTANVITGDICKVYAALEAVSQSRNIELEKCAVEDILTSLSTPIVSRRMIEQEIPGSTQISPQGATLPILDDGSYSLQVTLSKPPTLKTYIIYYLRIWVDLRVQRLLKRIQSHLVIMELFIQEPRYYE